MVTLDGGTRPSKVSFLHRPPRRYLPLSSSLVVSIRSKSSTKGKWEVRKKKGEEKRRSAGNKKQGEGIFPTEMVSRGGIGEQFLLRKGESVGPSISLFHGPPTHTTSHSHTYSPQKSPPFSSSPPANPPPLLPIGPISPLDAPRISDDVFFPCRKC